MSTKLAEGAGATQFNELAPHYDELMQVVPYAAWVEYIMLLWTLVDYRPQTVLDCACGTGNVTFELARCGYEVTGVDLSVPMIEAARNKPPLDPFAAAPRFEVADLTEFDLQQTFDGATCLYDSLNYILDPAALQSAFSCIARHVRPGGVFVFDLNSDFALRTGLFSQTSNNVDERLHYDWKATYDRDSQVCTVAMQFERKNSDGSTTVFHETHRERAYLIDEIKAMLREAGWKLLHAYDAYTLNRPHARSERWFFVAQRPELK